jgi:hypothetical protein
MRRGLALVAVGAAAAGCAPLAPAPGGLGAAAAGPTVRAQPEDGDLLAVVPADAELVMLVDLAQLRRSPWTRDVVKSGLELAAGGRPPGDQGFDEATDVDLLLMARMPAGSSEAGATLSVAQGRFDQARVTAAFREARPGATTASFRGCAMLTHEDEAVGFLTARTLVSGPLATVRAAIEASLGRARDVRQEPWLMAAREALEEGRTRSRRRPALELALRVTESVRERLRGELVEAAALERLAARVDLGETLDGAVVGSTSTRPQAEALAGRLRSEVGNLRGRRSLAALGLGPVLAGIRVSAPGARTVLDLQLSEAQRDQIAERLALVAKALAGSK